MELPEIFNNGWFLFIPLVLTIGWIVVLQKRTGSNYKKPDQQLENQLEQAFSELQEKNIRLEQQKSELISLADGLKYLNDMLLQQNEFSSKREQQLSEEKEQIVEIAEKIRDLNQHILAQNQEIETKKQELEDLNEEKNQLFGTVAHDLRNPLTSALSITALLKSELTEEQEDFHEYTAAILKSLDRMKDMVERMLDVQAIESRKIELKISQFCLGELLTEIGQLLKEKAERKKIKLSVEADSLEVSNDQHFIFQIVENLATNALKFSHPHTEIRIKLSSEEESALIEVIDQGPGISEEDQKKLFGKFQKLSARPTANESSTGLGLSIVKSLCERISASVECESELGKGATFRVKIPMKIAQTTSPN